MPRLRLALAAACALVCSGFAPASTNAPRAAALSATRRGRDGKIYIGEPEPLDVLGGLIGDLTRGGQRVADALLGPQPILIPIPVEMPRDNAPDGGGSAPNNEDQR